MVPDPAKPHPETQSIAPAIPAPRLPHIFMCCDCEAEHHSPDHHIPVGWSQQGADIRCADCTAGYARSEP